MISKACIAGIYQRKLEEIARLGVELTVVVPPGWRDERGWMPLERMYTRGYTLYETPMALNGNFHLHYYPHLGRIMAKTRPEIVHIDEEPYNLATLHATWLCGRVGARTLFFTWQNQLRRYPPPFSWLERYVYRQTTHAIAGNHEAVQVLRAKGYTGRVHVIPQFGVDPALYAPASAPTDHAFAIGYVGRLVPEKGVADLLQAAASLPGDWQLRLLGNGPQQQELKELAEHLGIAERIQFDVWLPSDRVPEYMSRLHALVLPSRTRPNWKEQFGRVLVEAMACGVPVIGSDSGEIPNVIDHAGLVFPEGDIAALRARLQSLMNHTKLWRKLSQQGRAHMQARYTQAQIAAQTVDVYRQIVQDR